MLEVPGSPRLLRYCLCQGPGCREEKIHHSPAQALKTVRLSSLSTLGRGEALDECVKLNQTGKESKSKLLSLSPSHLCSSSASSHTWELQTDIVLAEVAKYIRSYSRKEMM